MGSRTRRTLLAALAAAPLVLGLTPAPPAAADMAEQWDYEAHVAGMPSTSDPARTLVSASATRYYGGLITDAEVRATVELGAEPDAMTDSTLHLLFGVSSPDGCEPRWEFSLPTYDPGSAGTRSGTTVSFQSPAPADDGERWTCSYVELLGPGVPATAYDRLDGHYETTIIIDPGVGVVVWPRDDGRVSVGRWSALRLRLFARSDAARVVVDGWGTKPGVRVRPVVLGVEELDNKLVWLPVRLGVAKARTLVVRARAWNEDGELNGRYKVRLRLTPRC